MHCIILLEAEVWYNAGNLLPGFPTVSDLGQIQRQAFRGDSD